MQAFCSGVRSGVLVMNMLTGLSPDRSETRESAGHERAIGLHPIDRKLALYCVVALLVMVLTAAAVLAE